MRSPETKCAPGDQRERGGIQKESAGGTKGWEGPDQG